MFENFEEEAATSDKYKLSEKPLDAITKPNTLILDYPYESGQIREECYSFSKHLFKFNTKFNSHSRNLYHVDFYNQNDSYMFTISGSNVDGMHYTSVNINNDVVDNSHNDVNSYYLIMYNDDKNLTILNSYYFIDCLLEEN